MKKLKRNKILYAVLLIIFVIVILILLFNRKENLLIGVWESDDFGGFVQFNKDGSGIHKYSEEYYAEFTWKTEDNWIIMNVVSGDIVRVEYVVDRNKLRFRHEQETEWIHLSRVKRMTFEDNAVIFEERKEECCQDAGGTWESGICSGGREYDVNWAFTCCLRASVPDEMCDVAFPE